MRYRLEYANGLVEIIRSPAKSIKELRLSGRQNEGLRSIKQMD